MASATFHGVPRAGVFALTLFFALSATQGRLMRRATDAIDGEPHDVAYYYSQADPATSSSAFGAALLEAQQDIYEGERNERGQAHGQGTERFSNGGSYEGAFQYGKQHGFGVMNYASGGVYEGQWRLGVQHGRGTFRHAGGEVYEGEFARGKRHGRGKLTTEDGAVYEGEFKSGEANGWGTKTFADGDVYVGQWENGRRSGGCGMMTSDGVTGPAYEWKDEVMVKEFSSMAACKAAQSGAEGQRGADDGDDDALDVASMAACPDTCRLGCLFRGQCRSQRRGATKERCGRAGGVWCDF